MKMWIKPSFENWQKGLVSFKSYSRWFIIRSRVERAKNKILSTFTKK